MFCLQTGVFSVWETRLTFRSSLGCRRPWTRPCGYARIPPVSQPAAPCDPPPPGPGTSPHPWPWGTWELGPCCPASSGTTDIVTFTAKSVHTLKFGEFHMLEGQMLLLKQGCLNVAGRKHCMTSLLACTTNLIQFDL